MGKITRQIKQIESKSCSTCHRPAGCKCQTPQGKNMDIPHPARIFGSKPE